MKYIVIGIIKIYQMLPLLSHKMCRFYPTCSQYTIDAIKKYGTVKGIKLGIKRIKKCRPNGEYGYDPVK